MLPTPNSQLALPSIDISIEHAIASYFSQWLLAHPYLAWIFSHPLPSLGLLFLAIFSLWGLIKAIGRGIEQIWLFLLKTPFKLIQPIFGLIWGSILRIFGHNNFSGVPSTAKPAHSNTAARVDWILERLDSIGQEQDLLLQELATLVKSDPRQAETAITSDTQYKDL